MLHCNLKTVGGDESVVNNYPLVLYKFSFDLLEFIIFVLYCFN